MTSLDKKFEHITDPEEFLDFYPWIKEMPVCDTPHHVMLSKCLTGMYQGFKFVLNGNTVGIMLYVPKSPVMFITGIYLRKHINTFYDMFWDEVKKHGYSCAEAHSALPTEMFEKFSGMTRRYTVYRRDLTGE